MAKDQQLPLNPNKLSGLCGRLRCCLTYEHPGYKTALKRLPKVGTKVQSERGRGVVKKLDLVHETIAIADEETGELSVFTPDQLQWDKSEDLPGPRSRAMRRHHRRRH